MSRVLILHGYFRSGASHRVRIALNLKGVPYEQKFYHLRRGENTSPQYLALNPQGLVPSLQSDGAIITQSLAILEYLEEEFPEPPLLPAHPIGRARARSLADICAVDTHPLNNLRVLKYLEKELGLDEKARLAWCAQWFARCFGPLEARLSRDPETGRFCHGDQPTFADICLAPQVWSARRFAFDLSPYPTVCRVYENAASMDAFDRALPSRQPDAE